MTGPVNRYLTLPAGDQGQVEEGPGEEVMEVMEVMEQQSDMETRELQSLMTDHPAVVLTLLVPSDCLSTCLSLLTILTVQICPSDSPPVCLSRSPSVRLGSGHGVYRRGPPSGACGGGVGGAAEGQGALWGGSGWPAEASPAAGAAQSQPGGPAHDPHQR